MSPYLGARAGWKRAFNKRMDGIRTAAESSSGSTQTLWISNALKRQVKSRLMPVADLYKTSVLLTNCYTCLRRNQTTTQFQIKPPTLHEYLKVVESDVSTI